MAEDEFLEALTALEGVLADHHTRARLIKKRIAQIRRLRSRGASYTEIVSSKDGALIVQLLTESSTALDTCGANVRRAEAHALYAEGLTMEQIAERFGVTRQRISTLLRKAPNARTADAVAEQAESASTVPAAHPSPSVTTP
jgi:DNA-directed RNA polymerase sigma subunit (sigma70/sigma32)